MPPKTGAMVMASPMQPPQNDHARIRSRSSWKVWPMTASAEVSSRAEPTPLIARAMFIAVVVSAAPQASDARMKPTRPTSMVRRRPQRSAMLPAGSRQAAKASI